METKEKEKVQKKKYHNIDCDLLILLDEKIDKKKTQQQFKHKEHESSCNIPTYCKCLLQCLQTCFYKFDIFKYSY